MGEPKMMKPCNNVTNNGSHENNNKRNVFKMSSGGGGIGAVILMGGALATAALASAFVARNKGWNSGKDLLRQLKNPQPEHPSSEAARKEVEPETPMILDEEPGIEAKAVNDAVAADHGNSKDDSPSSDDNLPFDLKNVGHEEKIPLIGEDRTVEISKGSNNFKHDEIVGKKTSSDGEIKGNNFEESVDSTAVKPVEVEHTEICGDQQEESVVGVDIDHVEEEKSADVKANMDEKDLEGCIREETVHETEEDEVRTHLNVDEKEGDVSIETVGIIQENEFIEGGEKDEVGNVEEQLVKENEKFDRPGEGFVVPEKCGLQIIVEEEKCHSENHEEFGASVIKEEAIFEVAKDDEENTENCDKLELKKETLVNDNVDDVERNISEEEMILSQDIGVKEGDGSNEEVSEIPEVNENEISLPEDNEVEKITKDENEDSLETTPTEKDDGIMSEDNINDYNDEADETDISDEVDESSIETRDSSSVESNEDAVWPAESLSLEPQQVKLIDQEVQGKIKEDKPATFQLHQMNEEEFNQEKSSEDFPTMADSNKLTKSFIAKYKGELATMKILPTNSTGRRVIIAMLSVLSSLSCSWYFGVSFVKLCLIMFFSMALSEIHGY